MDSRNFFLTKKKKKWLDEVFDKYKRGFTRDVVLSAIETALIAHANERDRSALLVAGKGKKPGKLGHTCVELFFGEGGYGKNNEFISLLMLYLTIAKDWQELGRLERPGYVMDEAPVARTFGKNHRGRMAMFCLYAPALSLRVKWIESEIADINNAYAVLKGDNRADREVLKAELIEKNWLSPDLVKAVTDGKKTKTWDQALNEAMKKRGKRLVKQGYIKSSWIKKGGIHITHKFKKGQLNESYEIFKLVMNNKLFGRKQDRRKGIDKRSTFFTPLEKVIKNDMHDIFDAIENLTTDIDDEEERNYADNKILWTCAYCLDKIGSDERVKQLMGLGEGILWFKTRSVMQGRVRFKSLGELGVTQPTIDALATFPGLEVADDKEFVFNGSKWPKNKVEEALKAQGSVQVEAVMKFMESAWKQSRTLDSHMVEAIYERKNKFSTTARSRYGVDVEWVQTGLPTTYVGLDLPYYAPEKIDVTKLDDATYKYANFAPYVHRIQDILKYNGVDPSVIKFSVSRGQPLVAFGNPGEIVFNGPSFSHSPGNMVSETVRNLISDNEGYERAILNNSHIMKALAFQNVPVRQWQAYVQAYAMMKAVVDLIEYEGVASIDLLIKELKKMKVKMEPHIAKQIKDNPDIDNSEARIVWSYIEAMEIYQEMLQDKQLQHHLVYSPIELGFKIATEQPKYKDLIGIFEKIVSASA